MHVPISFLSCTFSRPVLPDESCMYVRMYCFVISIVAGTETIAVHQEANVYRLYGYKWFSSATDSDMTLTLARIKNEDGSLIPGTKGISMFLMKTRNDDKSLNNLGVVKLKNKLGTRQLPTAEILMDGAVAERISPVGRGIASISSMLTISRLHNIIFSVSGPRKIQSLARDYARRRKAFGKGISEHVLHLQALSRMETETRGCTALLIDLAHKMGQDDCKVISDEDSLLLRLMLPVGKMYTAKQGVMLTSEGLECFGGQGFIEDTGLPAFLRDAQVLPIWEGTSSVMSLDVLRAISKSKGETLRAFKSRVSGIVQQCQACAEIKQDCVRIEQALNGVMSFVVSHPEKLEASARDLTVSLAHVYIASLLAEHASYAIRSNTGERSAILTLKQWMQRDLSPVLNHHGYDLDAEVMKSFVYEGYDQDNLIKPTFIR